MAIIKTFETPQGIPATYHKIVKAEIEVGRQEVVIKTAVYFSAEARTSGKSPLWHEYVSIPFDSISGDFRSSLYEMLGNYYNSYLKNGAADESVAEVTPVVLDENAYIEPSPTLPDQNG